jgi:hypothetical protein
MKVWVDLTNAPHVRFFKNIIEYFLNTDDELIVTGRAYGDIHNIMNDYGFEFISVGKHGITLEQKLQESTNRAYELAKIMSKEKPDIALSKHSIELPRVSFGLGIPSLYVLDNEHALAANKLTLPLVDRIIMPEAIDMWSLIKLGANPNKIISYKGTSEIMHFNDFEVNENIFEDLGLDLKHEKTILMRPEPSLASYLNTDCRKSVLTPVVEVLEKCANILVIPRFKEQGKIFENYENVINLEPPIDTSSLLKKCDLMIGAGGTMNREAAVLGTPVISCYPGDTLAVDQYYVDNGLMCRSTEVNEIISMALNLMNNHHNIKPLKYDDLFNLVLNNVYDMVNK